MIRYFSNEIQRSGASGWALPSRAFLDFSGTVAQTWHSNVRICPAFWFIAFYAFFGAFQRLARTTRSHASHTAYKHLALRLAGAQQCSGLVWISFLMVQFILAVRPFSSELSLAVGQISTPSVFNSFEPSMYSFSAIAQNRFHHTIGLPLDPPSMQY